ncbi:MAG: acyl-CoA thioesterase [Candidatus Fibromonas sp.]|jgi:acyl-CoA thioester hydrolase|nr:acyl-CoA thioesterase [Candidatus Fibromonas sp.]
MASLSASVDFTVEFYEVDSMKIVWHGNYINYMERARCALLNKINYNYMVMEQGGYAWPVVDIKVRYIRPLRFLQKARIEATLLEYENRLKISYKVTDAETGTLLTKAESTHIAVNAVTGESYFESPREFIEKVRNYANS